MVGTKYQVFVSSTYEDLKAERDVAIRAVLEMGHIPVGMEMFSAADEEQWKIIARHIDESDYYCVLVAHRYGSTTGGVSFTRKEYEYAVSMGVPVLGFVLSDSAPWPAHFIDTSAVELAGLKEFRDLVKSRPVSFWTSSEDLYGKVSIALGKAFTTSPREGWVRASGVAGPEVTRELTRLSAENSSLREQIHALTASQELDKAAELTSLRQKLRGLSKVMSFKYSASDKSWTKAEPLTYYRLFWLLAPEMASESELVRCAKDLAMNIRIDSKKSWWTCPVNQVRDLLTEFMALGLAEPSKRKHAVADKDEYWSLTELGADLYRDIRLREIEARLGQADSAVQNDAKGVGEDQDASGVGASDMDADEDA